MSNKKRWKEPLRHTLIRLREQKPVLFGNRPIPLREVDIRRDDTFVAILAQEVRYVLHRRSHSTARGNIRSDKRFERVLV